MTLRRLSIPALACLLLALAPSCSVKEERSECKAFLDIVFSDSDRSGFSDRMTHVSLWDSGLQEAELRVNAEVNTFRVDRSDVTLAAFLTDQLHHGTIEGGVYRRREGERCDSLYACRKTFSTRGEDFTEEVGLRKRFAAVLFVFDEGAYDGWSARLVSSVVGTDLNTLAPVSGPHSEPVVKGADNKAFSVIPFHGAEDTLKLVFTPAVPGTPDVELDLMLYLDIHGYDWNKEDLDDIIVEVGSAMCDITVIPAEWQDGGIVAFI